MKQSDRAGRPSMTAAKRTPPPSKMPVSDAAVKAKTGRTWAQWCAVLDRAKADAMSHREIASLLHAKFDVGDWWCADGDRRLRARARKRAVNQTAQGFRTSVSRTIAAPAAAVYAAWPDEKLARRVAPTPALHRAHLHRAASPSASRGPTARIVEVTITAKGPQKTVARGDSTASSPARPRCAGASRTGRSASMRSATSLDR